MPTKEPPRTEEGLFVSHLLFQVSPDVSGQSIDDVRDQAEEKVELLENKKKDEKFDLVRITSSEADFMTVYFAETLEELDDFQRSLMEFPLGHHIQRVYTFLSVTELSMYESTEERVEKILSRKGLEEGTSEYEDERQEQMKRMEKYQEMRLNPEIPEMPYVTFYPMAKRRKPEQNWYQLPQEERAGMMKSHGKIGRKYGGDIQQIITSCVGLDDWEWGVTLYGDDAASFKRLIYEMRFDEVSASYSEFGPFYTGFKMDPEDFPTLFE